jgi:hypothetical protein
MTATKKITKTSMVLDHLKKHGTITSMEAIENYGATRLSAIIFNLRKKGYDIGTIDVHSKDRYGNSVVYGKYVLNA